MATDTIAQHTEGPWRVGDCCDIVATIDRVERTIAFTSPFADGGMVEAERHANARLIAAAPELLELVRLAVHFAQCAEVRSWPPGFQIQRDLIANGKAAIAKAENPR